MAHPTKPPGGYRAVPLNQLCEVWSAYRAGELSWLTVRVYFALQELWARIEAVARVKQMPAGRHGIFATDTSVHALQDTIRCARPSQVRAAVRALHTLKVMKEVRGAWWPTSPGIASCGARSMQAALGRTGSIPIPRRMLRWLAAEGTAVSSAYLLGAVVRTCHVRANGFQARGTCSIRFVAEAFRVDPRSVKRAAAAVRVLGWVLRANKPSTRLGAAVEVAAPALLGTAMSPQRTRYRTGMSPHTTCTKLLKDLDHQELGLRLGQKPLRQLRERELVHTPALNRRFREMVEGGLLEASEADRLRFFAAAQHALRVGRQNPCGLFYAVVTRGLWQFISHADEEGARALLREPAEAGQPRGRRRLDNLVTDLAAALAWPGVHTARKSSRTIASRPKNWAGHASPRSLSSSRMARSESRSTSMFSVSESRKADCSAHSRIETGGVISRPCHK